MNGPKQVPDNSEQAVEWNDWLDYKSPEKSSLFEYSDSTKQHIDEGESQKFHYEGVDFRDKTWD